MAAKSKSDWNKNNAAHAFTWADLILFYELSEDVKFSEAESFKTRNLIFHAQAAGAEAREKRAKALADRLDRAYRLFHGAKLENGKKRSDAIKEMTEVLLGKNKTVGDLGRKADENYLFHTEIQ